METKPISLFKSQFIWAVIVFLIVVGGFICQLGLDLYTHVYCDCVLDGWNWSFIALLLVLFVLLIWVFIEFSNVITIFQSVVLKKDPAIEILAEKSYSVGSFILLVASIPITYLSWYLSVLVAAMYFDPITPVGEIIEWVYTYMPSLYSAEIIWLGILIASKLIIYNFFTDKEGRVIQKQLKE